MSRLSNKGNLKLIIGPMFSSKTSNLLSDVRKYKGVLEMKVLLVSPEKDNREDGCTIGTHDGKLEKAVKVRKISQVLNYLEYDVYGIDEAQLFGSELREVIQSLLENNKIIIVAALNADSDRQPFGYINDLISMADEIQHQRAICAICKDGTPGCHTRYIGNRPKESQIEIGGRGTYIPVCRECIKVPYDH